MPKNIMARGSRLWMQIKDEGGKWVRKQTPYNVGQEKDAARYQRRVQERINARRESGETAPTPDTVRAVAERLWIPSRRELDLDWNNDEARLRHHVLPIIGDMKIADVRTKHIVDLFHRIRTVPRKGADEVPSQRTVYNIYSTVAAMFRDAKLWDLIEQTPCELDSRHLGRIRDKDPAWRESALFTREEVETIISTPKIPHDRRVAYAIELLGGTRPGESAALRWRNYDATKEPLGELLVAHAYNSKKNRVKGTKTDSVKHVPVHPTLAAILAEWRLHGWAEMMGRPPTPDDLILPLPPKAAERRRSRTGEHHRGHDYSGKRWRDEDLPALGWRHRRHYDMRATFITLTLEDGADAHVIETRVTHTKKRRSAFDGYNRGEQWAATCREVAKLRVSRRELGTALGTVVAISSEISDMNGGGGGSRTRIDGCTDPLGSAVSDENRPTDARETGSERTAPVPSLSTVAAALEEALRQGDVARAMKLVAEIREAESTATLARPLKAVP